MTEPFVWRAHSTGELLQAVPALLGFHPREALVLVIVDAERVRVTARVDLAAITSYAALRHGLTGLLKRYRQPWVLAAAYTGDAERAWEVLDLVDLVLPDDWGLCPVHVHDDRWFAGPGDWGRPYDPGSSLFAAEAVFRGRAVLGDRQALAAALDVQDEAAATAALGRVLELEVEQTLRRAGAILAGHPRAAPSGEEAAVLAVAAFSDAFAADVLLELDAAGAEEARGFWTSVVRQVPEYAAAPACLILGVAAWLDGDGALLNVCLDRARPYADETPWFAVLEGVVHDAVSPDRWPELRRCLERGAAA